MGTFSDTTKNSMLDSISSPVFVQLHVGDPGSAGTANVATETARKSITLAAASAGTRVGSGSTVEWTNYPAAETITWVSVFSASSGGTFHGKHQLAASKSPGVGDTLTLAPADVTLSI